MKVSDGWSKTEYSVEEALYELIETHVRNCHGGVLEETDNRARATQELLIKFIAMNIKSIEQLNELSGYNRWEEK